MILGWETHLKLVRLLEGLKANEWTTSKGVKFITLGLQGIGGGRIVKTCMTSKHAGLTQELAKVPDLWKAYFQDDSFTWSTAQIVMNKTADKFGFRLDNILGPALFCSLGAYSGGEMMVEDTTLGRLEIPTLSNIVMANGLEPRSVKPYKIEVNCSRFEIIFCQLQSSFNLPPDDAAWMSVLPYGMSNYSILNFF